MEIEEKEALETIQEETGGDRREGSFRDNPRREGGDRREGSYRDNPRREDQDSNKKRKKFGRR